VDDTKRRHLVTVWNPSYSADPMDAHLAVLSKSIHAYRNSEVGVKDVYVWWGKVRSRNRVQELPHAPLIKEVAEDLARGDSGRETHLYLTDYRSLYVGQVTQMVDAEVRDNDTGRVAEYMRTKECPSSPLPKGQLPPYSLDVDWWFKLNDIRPLVLDDTVSVVRELAQLRNLQYHNRPVSLYGGMVDLPLVVESEVDRSYFSRDERDHLSHRNWWVELDAQRGRGIAEIERDLRDNVLGEIAWSAFDPTTRAFIADGERLFRAHRKDPAFDFSGAILNFSKAIEVHFRSLVRAALAANPELNAVVTINNKSADLRQAEMPTLGQIAYLTRNDAVFRNILKALNGGNWLINEFLSTLGRLAPVRNEAAHDQRIDVHTAAVWRNALLGVGCPSVLVELAKVQRPGK
jgi:hypothetical protein